MSRKLAPWAAWAALVIAFAIVFRSSTSTGSWPVVTLAALAVSAAVMVLWRAAGALRRLQQLLAEGRPDPMLRIVRRRLRYRGGGRNRGPLLVFKAAALSMKGEWERGLEVLDEIDPAADLPEERRLHWELATFSTRFSCLIFLERIDEARALYEAEIAPRADDADAKLAAEAMEAELWFCEGARGEARTVFERLVGDYRLPASARAVFHYFLGRIYRGGGDREASDAQFERARQIAGKTWIPAGIDAIEREEEEMKAAFRR